MNVQLLCFFRPLARDGFRVLETDSEGCGEYLRFADVSVPLEITLVRALADNRSQGAEQALPGHRQGRR